MRFNSGRSNVTCETVAGDMSRAAFSAPAARCRDMGSSTILHDDGAGTLALQAGNLRDSYRICHSCPEMVTIEPWRGRFRPPIIDGRLAVSRFGLTSPPAPFRVGIAPTDISNFSTQPPPRFSGARERTRLA